MRRGPGGPWAWTREYIDEVADAVRRVIEPDAADLMHPVLRAEHRAVVDMIERLPWNITSVSATADLAVEILMNATRAGGPIDPAFDDVDAPWALAVNRARAAPDVASRFARRWFAHGERLLSTGEEVSALFLAVAAYYVAAAEVARHREHEVSWWLKMGSVQAEVDERTGFGLVAVVRFARLFKGRVT